VSYSVDPTEWDCPNCLDPEVLHWSEDDPPKLVCELCGHAVPPEDYEDL
jgi:hypothetical protein